MVTERELRLRQRIDTLTAERDKALEALWESRADNEDLERKLLLAWKRNRVTDLKKSRAMWRQRARDAEAMLRQRQRRKVAAA